MRCPGCGGTGSFTVYSAVLGAQLGAGGTVEASRIEWCGEEPRTCDACAHEAVACDFEEVDDGEAWPEPAACVKALRRREAAQAAARALVEAYRRSEEAGGSVDWEDLDVAHALALRAVEK